MKIQVIIFWGVTPSSDVVGYQRFGERCWLHLGIVPQSLQGVTI